MTSASAPITNSGAVRKWGGSAALRPSTSQPANSARASFSVTTKNARQLGVNSAPAEQQETVPADDENGAEDEIADRMDEPRQCPAENPAAAGDARYDLRCQHDGERQPGKIAGEAGVVGKRAVGAGHRGADIEPVAGGGGGRNVHDDLSAFLGREGSKPRLP